jgi:hypothetical protein
VNGTRNLKSRYDKQVKRSNRPLLFSRCLALQFLQTKIFKYYNGEQVEMDERGRGHVACMRQRERGGQGREKYRGERKVNAGFLLQNLKK